MTSILTKVRQIMKLKKLNWYILPRTDQHQSQYICQCDKRVQFISGFTGTNAFSLISQDQAFLWTDGRYFIQAQKQLKQGWKLKKLITNQKKWNQYLIEKYNPNKNKIGIDSRLISASITLERFKSLKQIGYQIIAQPKNLIDQVWQNRPIFQQKQIFIHQQWAGKSINQKVNWVRSRINQKNGNAAIFNGLSQIAWILNLRSSQIPNNPYFKSILIISKQSGTLYLPESHKSFYNQNIRSHLLKVNIQISNYPIKFDEKTLIQSSNLTFYLYQNLPNPIQWQGIGLYRAIRPNKQIQGFKNCHIRDGVAMAKFWAWRSKKDICNQYEAVLQINKLRKQQLYCQGTSFQTTSAGGPNAAIIHYKPSLTSSLNITKDMIHLLDSGGQYLDGTTDVTRTFHFGKPSDEQKNAYTRVLLGNLDVQRMRWPKNVNLQGRDFDLLARRHLFQVGQDYQHGTGHGVGYFLGVHQGPVGISKINNVIFKPGMIVSNEPGYYQEGKFGIRIQNLIMVQQDEKCYYFQNFTLCPYDLNLINKQLLSQKDKKYINDYHKKVLDTLQTLLKDDKQTIQWLELATRAIQ